MPKRSTILTDWTLWFDGCSATAEMAFGERTAGVRTSSGVDTAASLIFGGGGAPEPSRVKPPSPAPPQRAIPRVAPQPAPGPMRAPPQPLAAMTGAAGALGWQAPDARSAAEAHGFRRQRAAQRDPRLQYDEHIADVEEQAFSKLRHNLNRLERKAEREHACYDGAAGYSTEKRVERSDWEQDGARRNRLATPRGDNDSVAALISHSAPPMVTKLVVASGENLVPVMVSCVPEGAAAGNTDDMVGVCSSE